LLILVNIIPTLRLALILTVIWIQGGQLLLGQGAPPTTSSVVQAPASSSDQMDRIFCTDGTVVEGRIIDENMEQVRIETRRGTFSYQRVDIRRIERAAAKATPSPTPKPTPFFDINRVLPSGPLNPANPPKIPPLYTHAAAALRQAALAAQPPATPTAAPQSTPVAVPTAKPAAAPVRLVREEF
jgi:hypothetical protein